jgi:hypothetical protein
VLQGRPGGFEQFQNGGAMAANMECVSTQATVLNTWAGSYSNRLMRAQADANGMDQLPSRCSICCTGGCYVAFGTGACATGYTKVYGGRVGGVEAFDGPQVYGKSLCLETGLTASFAWNSGYSNRLMRHRESLSTGGANGMDSVDNSCSFCCKE